DSLRPYVNRRFIVDPIPDLPSDRIPDFLRDVPDQADRTPHDRDPPAQTPVDPEFARDRPDGAGRVDRQHLAGNARGLRGDALHELAVVAEKSVLASELEEPWGPRIDRFVKGMAETRDERSLRAEFGDDPRREGVQVTPFAPVFQRFLE